MWSGRLLLVAVWSFFGGSCSDSVPKRQDPLHQDARESPGQTDRNSVSSPVLPEKCPVFTSVDVSNRLDHPEIREASGIVASRKQPGIWWVHNDSGDDARLFAIDDRGKGVAEVRLIGVVAADLEDIALGPGPDPNIDYLYIGDIGDNFLQREFVTVYRIPEPQVFAGKVASIVEIDTVASLEISYESAKHRAQNAETLLSDPVTGDLYIVTRNDTGSAILHYPFPHEEDVRSVVHRVGETLFFGVGALALNPTVHTGQPRKNDSTQLATGGDISSLGNQVLIRTYNTAFVWLRRSGATLVSAFDGEPCPVPIGEESQGESIGFSPDAQSYVTVSERKEQLLHRFSRVD